MAITQEYLNMDSYYRFTGGHKVIINHFAYLDSQATKDILDKLTTVYTGDTISAIPVCDCGYTKGRYLVGMSCPECSSTCTDPKDRNKPLLWFECLDASMPFINPAFWNSLQNLLHKKIDLLRWLVDPRYNPKSIIPAYIILAKDTIMGGVRGYFELVSNLPEILDYFVNSTELKGKTNYSELVLLRASYRAHKSDITSTYLPVLNKKLFVIENTTKGTYTNLVLGDIIDAISTWRKASDDHASFRNKSLATGLVVAKLAELYVKYYVTFLITKPGCFRKHIYGARSHFTFRTVISAAKGKHKHNEFIPPWIISVTTYRPHILNKLIRKGYSYKAADNLLNRSIMTYFPIIEEIQKELVRESPHKQGLPVLVNRNPSLLQGSSLLMYITEFNTDPKTLTSTFSPLSAASPNADFDGD